MRKLLKIIGLVLLAAILIFSGLVAYSYYEFDWKYRVDSEKYPNAVGYIGATTASYTTDFSLCDTGRLIGYYHSAAPGIYRGDKYAFKQRLQKKYRNNDYQDSGYLNLRFYINCHGEIGYLESNELDEDLERTDHTDELVEQIIQVVMRQDNWELFGDSNANYYMYLNFKIKDGDIVEVLP